MNTSIIKLEVPYVEKDLASSLGARWDADDVTWYCTEHTVERLRRWLPYQPLAPEMRDELASAMALPEHIEYVRKLSQSTSYREWMLLMLGADQWGAFWAADLEGSKARLVFEGKHAEGCRFIGNSPRQALEFMEAHRLSKPPKPRPEYLSYEERKDLEEQQALESSQVLECDAELRIGGKTIKLKLPSICEQLIQSFDTDHIELDSSSEISLQIYELLDSFAPDSAKYPLDDQLLLAQETSACLRVPLPTEALINRERCQEFIHEYERDLTLYRQILLHWSSPNKALAKRVRDYSKWSLARDWLRRDRKPWQELGDLLGIKREATLQKYADQADEADAVDGEWLSTKLCVDLIALERAGASAFDELTRISESMAWDEFKVEREARRLRAGLRAAHSPA